MHIRLPTHLIIQAVTEVGYPVAARIQAGAGKEAASIPLVSASNTRQNTIEIHA
jgi:hypothetical protein